MRTKKIISEISWPLVDLLIANSEDPLYLPTKLNWIRDRSRSKEEFIIWYLLYQTNAAECFMVG